ncbi:hypothetical protein D1007_12315 [Hordeum vulgare]|nr:hypothetical protein D1007_12315 [Hordeum vulgare]
MSPPLPLSPTRKPASDKAMLCAGQHSGLPSRKGRRAGHHHCCAICPIASGEDEQGFQREAEEGSYEETSDHSICPDETFPESAFLRRSFHRRQACLEQVHNAPPSGTVESDYENNSQQRYKDMDAFEGIFFKLEHCWELLKNCDKWTLIERESPSKRGSLRDMDEDEDDDDPRNLNKPDGDKKTKKKIKREREASTLRDKIYSMLQSDEVLLAKSLDAKIELAEKKPRVKQERCKLLKEVEERKARAAENKTMANLLAEEIGS